jgi:hypothetical protein
VLRAEACERERRECCAMLLLPDCGRIRLRCVADHVHGGMEGDGQRKGRRGRLSWSSVDEAGRARSLATAL